MSIRSPYADSSPTLFTSQHVAGQNKENTVAVAVLTVQYEHAFAVTCLWGKATFFVQLLARANADTVARHTTQLT